MSDEDRALAYKFRGFQKGGSLRVDGIGEFEGANIFDENGKLMFRKGTVERYASNLSYGSSLGVPKFLRAEWRDKVVMEPDGGIKRGFYDSRFYGGTILGDYTVPVASRIPDALLDDYRAGKGGFRLKIRLHDDGILVGWDMPVGRGDAPDGSDYIHAGGDFREATPAYIYNKSTNTGFRKMLKGWYIHPKTKERIETDF